MEFSEKNKKMLEDVKTSVNVTRGEFEVLQHEVKYIRQLLENKTTYSIPDKVAFIMEIARMLNLSIGEVKELN